MNVAHSHLDLENYLNAASGVSKDHPVVISKFILEAKVWFTRVLKSYSVQFTLNLKEYSHQKLIFLPKHRFSLFMLSCAHYTKLVVCTDKYKKCNTDLAVNNALFSNEDQFQKP